MSSSATELVNTIAAQPPRLGEKSAVLSRRSLFGGILLMIVGLIIGYSGHEMSHFFHAWLVGSSFVLSIALGGLFFTLIHHLTAAGWSTMMRRQAEFMASLLPFAAVLFAPIVLPTLFGYSGLYSWADAEWAAADPIVAKKTGYLNGVFFCIRMALYFVLWFEMQRWFVKNSFAQDSDGDAAKSVKMRSMAAPATLIFALSVTFFAFDALMSLDPHWFSTIFGVYFFAGCALSLFSLMALTVAILRAKVPGYAKLVTKEHTHDIGKFMFGFTFFWGYIAFSQYMLIWYANVPEETAWFELRGANTDFPNAWTGWSLALLFGHFLIPFPGLLSRHVKRNPKVLATWAVYILVMQLLDMFWLIRPEMRDHGGAHDVAHVNFHAIDVAAPLGVVLLAVGFWVRWLAARPLVAHQDPRLGESLALVNQ